MTTVNRFVPYIPDNAPFSAEQRAWLNGYFASVFSAGQGAVTQMQTQPPVQTITVVFGSQSGTAEMLAKRTAKAAKQRGFASSVLDAASVDVAVLAQMERLVLITSTYGEGEPPDNIAALHVALHAPQSPALPNLTFCVLALGDTSYAQFCKTGKDFDARLEKLGATRMLPVALCDVDYEANYTRWLSTMFDALAPNTLAVTPSISTPAEAEENGRYSKLKPFEATVLKNVNLHSARSAKQTRHIEFSLRGSGLTYDAGDALGVLPMNDVNLVDELIALTGFDANATVVSPSAGEISLREALLHEYDIHKLTFEQVALFAERTQDAGLQQLVQPDKAAELSRFLWGRGWVDLVCAHPKIFSSPQDWVNHLRKLQPRLYSISSSQKAYPEQVHLTVSLVQYVAHGRARTGVCSGNLAATEIGASKRVFVHANKQFKLPANSDADIIMVGPGTGIAPFRAFLQERVAVGARGRNWLFFGCWTSSDDFLYRDELEAHQQNGVLNKLAVAFSREQTDKVYVQHLLEQNASELWAWLQGGAYFYVCGDAAKMAKDVDAALHAVAEKAGGLSPDQAVAFVAALRKQKRYLRDVY